MKDREKVIGFLKEAAEYFRECRNNVSFASKEENHFWELQNAANEALELLKEQEPGKVLHVKDRSINATHGRTGFCPRCNQLVVWGVNRRYCGFCGKGLIWDESK